jgi:tetratricopeptide (TPR) repeat protein
LRHEVDLRRKTDKLIERQDIVDLRKKLADIEQNRVAVSVNNKPGRIKYAAVIAAFVIIGGVILLSRGRPGPDELFDRYYKTYEPSFSVRSGLNSGNQDFNLALEYYKLHDYRNAAIYFSKVVQKEPEDMHSSLLNGISNFEISNYPEAENSFVRVIDDDDNLFIDHAQWYLSMCYIKTNELGKAKDQLAQIAESESIYRKNAKHILKRL